MPVFSLSSVTLLFTNFCLHLEIAVFHGLPPVLYGEHRMQILHVAYLGCVCSSAMHQIVVVAVVVGFGAFEQRRHQGHCTHNRGGFHR